MNHNKRYHPASRATAPASGSLEAQSQRARIATRRYSR